MTVKYKTVITKAGAIKLAAATVPNGKKVNFTAMAIGDGGGTLPTPDANQTKLINEVWRYSLNKISQDAKNKNYVVAELLIPPERGGFWMREMGLYDDTGTLIAVGNMAESYKPELAEGSGRAQTVRMVIMVSDIESVELTIDTTMVMATQDYVDDKLAEHEQSRRHPDATLKEKGFTQLSNATDSESESVAATPKAVKVAYDLAKGKYTAQDATTTQKGIVQLSSATDSTSESVAATSKAVKAANDNANSRVPNSRTVNGRALTSNINVTSQDIFNGQAIGLGANQNLDSYQTPGIYYQSANANTSTVLKYPENNAGALIVMKSAGVTQIYYVYNSSRVWSRSKYADGAWTAWAREYNTLNKPSAADVGALASSGTAVAAAKLATARLIGGVSFDGSANINLPGVNTQGNQNTTANAGSATKLQTARTINGISFNGTANITIPASAIGSYTKAESDSRYVQSVRLGARTATPVTNSNWSAANGGVITEYNTKGAGIYRLLQVNRNNTWVTISVL